MTAAPQQKPKKSKRLPRPSLLPLLMGAMFLLISVRVGHVVQDVSVSVGSRSEAQAQPQTPAPAAPAPAPPTTPTAAAPMPAATPAPATAATNTPPATPAAAAPATPAPATPASATPAPAAATPAAPASATPAAANGAVSPDTNLAAKTPTDPLDYTDEEVDVLQQLAKRREELDQRATQLDEREALVAAAEQRMDQKLSELKALEGTLNDLLKQRSDKEEQQLLSLVKMYENMKPGAAAQVFEELDMDVLLDVVSRMKERKVAPIMALMSPTRAKELTVELAQQRQLPMAP